MIMCEAKEKEIASCAESDPRISILAFGSIHQAMQAQEHEVSCFLSPRCMVGVV